MYRQRSEKVIYPFPLNALRTPENLFIAPHPLIRFSDFESLHTHDNFLQKSFDDHH